jgi:hypothetical protein
MGKRRGHPDPTGDQACGNICKEAESKGVTDQDLIIAPKKERPPYLNTYIAAIKTKFAPNTRTTNWNLIVKGENSEDVDGNEDKS